jgi:hypothetical protein
MDADITASQEVFSRNCALSMAADLFSGSGHRITQMPRKLTCRN